MFMAYGWSNWEKWVCSFYSDLQVILTVQCEEDNSTVYINERIVEAGVANSHILHGDNSPTSYAPDADETQISADDKNNTQQNDAGLAVMLYMYLKIL